MNQTTQQIPSNPARDFANAIRAEFNNGLELIEILHDIAQGNDENATGNDRIAANNILLDRGLGKCPKQSPATAGSNPDPDTDSKPRAKEPKAAHSEPNSPRLVTQIDDSLHDSLGPAPNAQPLTQQSPEPLDPFSIQATIQRHILTITDNGLTLLASLAEIARAQDDPQACPEQEPALSLPKPVLTKAEGGRRIKTSHRRRAAQILIDRLAGTDPTLSTTQSAPNADESGPAHDGSHAHTEDPAKEEAGPSHVQSRPRSHGRGPREIQRMKDEGILTPDPNAKKIDITPYLPPDDFDLSPYAKEEAAKFWANIELRYERQKAWPAIEERRRKKLEQIYPSHSDDNGEQPDT